MSVAFHIASYCFLAFAVYVKIKNSEISKMSVFIFDKSLVEELILQKQNLALLQLQFPGLSQGPQQICKVAVQ